MTEKIEEMIQTLHFEADELEHMSGCIADDVNLLVEDEAELTAEELKTVQQVTESLAKCRKETEDNWHKVLKLLEKYTWFYGRVKKGE